MDDPNEPQPGEWSGNGTSWWLDSEERYRLNLVSTVIEGPLAVLAPVGNLLTILAVWRCPALRTVCNMYVASLAVADFLVGILVPWKIALTYFGKDMSVESKFTECLLLNCSFFTLTTASMLTITAISVDRLLNVRLCLHYPIYITSRTTRYVIAAIWVVAFAVGAVPVLTVPPRSENASTRVHCHVYYMQKEHRRFQLYGQGGVFCLCSAVSFLCYGYIVLLALKHKKAIARLNPGTRLGSFHAEDYTGHLSRSDTHLHGGSREPTSVAEVRTEESRHETVSAASRTCAGPCQCHVVVDEKGQTNHQARLRDVSQNDHEQNASLIMSAPIDLDDSCSSDPSSVTTLQTRTQGKQQVAYESRYSPDLSPTPYISDGNVFSTQWGSTPQKPESYGKTATKGNDFVHSYDQVPFQFSKNSQYDIAFDVDTFSASVLALAVKEASTKIKRNKLRDLVEPNGILAVGTLDDQLKPQQSIRAAAKPDIHLTVAEPESTQEAKASPKSKRRVTISKSPRVSRCKCTSDVSPHRTQIQVTLYILVFGLFFLLWGPTFLVLLLGVTADGKMAGLQVLFPIGLLNSVCNIPVYAWKSHDMRRSMKKILTTCWGWINTLLQCSR